MLGKYDKKVVNKAKQVIRDGRRLSRSAAQRATKEVKTRISEIESEAEGVVETCKNTWNKLPGSTKTLVVLSSVLVVALLLKGKSNKCKGCNHN